VLHPANHATLEGGAWQLCAGMRAQHRCPGADKADLDKTDDKADVDKAREYNFSCTVQAVSVRLRSARADGIAADQIEITQAAPCFLGQFPLPGGRGRDTFAATGHSRVCPVSSADESRPLSDQGHVIVGERHRCYRSSVLQKLDVTEARCYRSSVAGSECL
jgi:hypothetical protein